MVASVMAPMSGSVAVSQNVMVVGRGKPYHVPLVEAERLVHEGLAVWQKANRRIKYTASKHSRPKMRDLSCIVGVSVATALRSKDRGARDVAQTFMAAQLRRRGRVRIERINGAYIDLVRDLERVEREREEIRVVAELAVQAFGAAPKGGQRA
jgi:hypothetical protein